MGILDQDRRLHPHSDTAHGLKTLRMSTGPFAGWRLALKRCYALVRHVVTGLLERPSPEAISQLRQLRSLCLDYVRASGASWA